jgi:predicted nucleotidyltransferase
MSEKQRPSHTLDDLVDIIARTVDPDQIVLFGSQAKGTAHRESDYDFLVVMPDVQNERQISRRIYRALLDQHVGVAVDVVVVDTHKLAYHRDTPGYIYQQALQEGEVCYDRARV